MVDPILKVSLKISNESSKVESESKEGSQRRLTSQNLEISQTIIAETLHCGVSAIFYLPKNLLY